MTRISLLCVLVLTTLASPCAAQEPPPATAGEELTRTLLQKGVLSETEAKGLLDRFALERAQAPSRLGTMNLKGMKLEFMGLGEFRFTHTAGSHKSADGTTPSFKVNTARLGFTGEVTPRLSYTAVFAFERTNGATDKVNSALYDVKLSYTPIPRLSLSAGQFVMPVSEEANEPTAKLDLPDRHYAAGRLLNPSFNHDIGVAAHGRAFGKRLDYAAGVFNGRGPNVTANDDDNFLYAARVGGVPLEWDMLGSKAQLYVGINGMFERTAGDASPLRTDSGTAFTEEYDRRVYGWDGQVRWNGFRIKGEYLGAQLLGRHNNDPHVHADGWYAQVSQLIGTFEPLVRYQAYDPDWRSAPAKDIRWTTLGLNWFIRGDTVKAQAAYTFKREASAGYANDELVTQVQLFF